MTKKWERTYLSASFWDKMIVISCVIAISLDSLFLYIPFIDEEKKCLGMDKKLRNVALILRSLADITFLVHIGYLIYEGVQNAYKEINLGKEQWELDWQATLIRRDEIIPFAVILARELKWCSLVTELLSVFPMPQVIGAFWYFFFIQRETSCWYQACQNNPQHEGCKTTFYCDDDKTSTEVITNFFDEHCKIDVLCNTTAPFEYGIFLDSLKSGNAGHINFPTKLAYSYWWGLRNLSNFGTNLTTSNYVWENLFTILISITGLLLFIYLIGNVQIYREMRTAQKEEIRKKLELKMEDIDMWMKRYQIDDEKEEIMKNINKKLEEGKDDELENLFNVLPGYLKKKIKHLLCFEILSQVKLLKLMNDNVLRMMCDSLTPVTYPADDFTFPMGGPIDRMLLIMEGTVLTYRSITPNPGAAPSPTATTRRLGKGDVYGENLLTWASADKSGFEALPRCTEYVKCATKVEGFTLSAQDLLRVVSKHRHSWKLYFEP